MKNKIKWPNMKPLIYMPILLIANLACAQIFESSFEDENYNEIEDSGREITQEYINKIMQSDIENLIKRLDYFEKHDKNKYNEALKVIRTTQNELISYNRLMLPTQCAILIKNGDFTRASEVIKRVYPFNFDEVVHFAYDDNPDNFNVIVRFADSLYNKNSTLTLYQELFKKTRNELENVDHFVSMMVNIKRYYDNPMWSQLKKDVLSTISTKLSADITSKAHKFQSAHSNSQMNVVYDLDEATGFKLMESVIHKLYTKFNVDALIKFIHGHQKLPLRVHGFATLYDKIIQDNLILSHSVFYLATMYRMTTYDLKHDKNTKIELDKLINKLPKCVKNAALSWKVCLKNKVSGNYFKVSNNNKDSAWRVLVTSGETTYDRTKWRFEAMDNGLYVMLKNTYINRSIKEGTQSWMGDRFSNKIEVSLPINSGDTWSIHAVAHAGDTCYIKRHSMNDRYLRDYEGSVMISPQGDDNSKWFIEVC